MNKQTKMNSSQLLESIERDPSTSHWLLEQVRHYIDICRRPYGASIHKRDLYDLMLDVDRLKQVLDLKWDETTRELRAEQLRAEQAKMVDDFLAGKCEHPI